MEIILKENYPSLGYVGDIVKVKDGYARNFLIPRGIGVEASSRNERLFKHKMAGINARRIKLRAEAETLAKKLDGLILEFTLRAGDGGRLFGSIGARDIEAALKEKELQIERAQIKLVDTLKKAGEYKVSLKLHAEVQAPITVRIVADLPAKKADEEGKDKKRGRGRGKKADAVDGEESQGELPAEQSEVMAADGAEAEKPKAKRSSKKKAAKDEADSQE